MLAVAEGWLADSQINLTAFVAEQPKEERPHLALGRPLAVQILKDGNLSVEGFAVRTGFEATIAQYEGLLGPLAVSWNGEQGRLTPVVGDMVMPSLSVDPGFLTTAMGSLLGETMDWNLIAESLSFADVSLTLASEGAKAPDAALLGYEQHPAPATFVATSAVKISRSTGDIAVLGTTLPLGFVEGLTGMEITNVVTRQVSPFEGVESLGVRLGPNGLAITVNGQRAMLAWDEQTRDNLVALAVKLFVDSYQGPAPKGGLLQDPVATLMAALKKADLGALQDAVAALNQGEVGFSVSLQEGLCQSPPGRARWPACSHCWTWSLLRPRRSAPPAWPPAACPCGHAAGSVSRFLAPSTSLPRLSLVPRDAPQREQSQDWWRGPPMLYSHTVPRTRGARHSLDGEPTPPSRHAGLRGSCRVTAAMRRISCSR